VNPSKFKAPFLTNQDILAHVDGLREKHPVCRTAPFDILAFSEFDLGLQPYFADIRQSNQDAILLPDLSGIVFDGWVYKQTHLYQRLRFSAAHELGHLFLHDGVYGSLDFTTIKQWIAFINSIPAVEYYWIERHADEFAGQLLMPTNQLVAGLNESIDDAEREGIFSLGAEDVLEFCCRAMHNEFGVSFPAMQTRIRKSGLWPHPKIKISN
jgi:hypothetical protein